MPISRVSLRNMRMNVSQQHLLHELALKANCNYNPDKEEIKELTKGSMQCMKNSLTAKDNVDNHFENQISKGERILDSIITNKTNYNNKVEASPKIRRTFIPYPDHNYGQQPPLTPPATGGKPFPPSLIGNNTETSNHPEKTPKQLTSCHITETKEEQEGSTKCICGFQHDDGYMICCDDCSTWQHIDCMGIKSSKVPEKYSCHNCNPRELDIERAKAIQSKKRENMSEGDDEDDEETASEDEAGKTMYTAISNTPTRITLLSNSNVQVNPLNGKPKNRKGSRVQKRKLTDQRNPRTRKNRRRDKGDSVSAGNEDLVSFCNSDSLTNFFSTYKLYDEIEENKYDEDFQNMHFNQPEAVPPIDFLSKVVKCHVVCDVTPNRKGLLASSSIPSGNFVLEYKGLLISRKKYETLNPVFKESCPYTVRYNKLDNIELVIDARNYGNDARFLRRSCTPNAELKHITLNGALHVMIISCVHIEKDKEITIPFDYSPETFNGYTECACKIETCIVRKHNNERKRLNDVESNTPIYEDQIENSSFIKTETNEANFESESELAAFGEDSKHEKLSREERKLQAVMKQFEKLEKRQDTVKKPKTPGSRQHSTDENTNPGSNGLLQKPPLIKKTSGTRRKIYVCGKRRTRQSSCSSEPVSPSEQENTGVLSTPTTPLNNSQPQSLFEHANAIKNRKREKEPLTLTLPIQRKAKLDHQLASPTPPGTPVILYSPSRSLYDHSAFELSLDTNSLMESTPMKGSMSNGLLQIASNIPHTPLSDSICSTGFATAEEKIGDPTSRCNDGEPTSPYSGIESLKLDTMPRKYYGSIKKHWLNAHSQSNPTKVNGQVNGSTQISLAALVASLSQQHHMQNMAIMLSPTTPIFKRPQSCVPLKKRHLLLASKKSSIPSTITSSQGIITQRNVNIPQSTLSHKLDDCRTNHLPNKNLNVDTNPEQNVKLVHVRKGFPKRQSTTLSERSVTEQSKQQTSTSSESKLLLNPSVVSPFKHLYNQNTDKIDEKPAIVRNETTSEISSSSSPIHSQTNVECEYNESTVSKRPFVDENHTDLSMLEPYNKKNRFDPVTDDSGNDFGLRIVVTESSPAKSESNSLIIDTRTSCVISADQRETDIPMSQFCTPTSINERKSSVQSDPRSVPTSPRSSIDSNPDPDHINGQHGESTGKKKLSIKEYRNRNRNQKVSSSIVNQSAQPPLPNSDYKYQQPPLPYISSTDRKIPFDQTTDLLTPRTLSLRENIENKPIYTSMNSETNDSLNQGKNSADHVSSELLKTVGKSPEPMKKSNERSQSTASNNSVFEPVSPGNEFESASPTDEAGSFNNSSIHSDITKNPFTIHNDITKNPFGKKHNHQPQGLLQFLSAQKYPHLATLSGKQNHQSSSGQPQHQLSSGTSTNQHRSHGSTEYRTNEIPEADDDASSTHSSMSSTSYGSLSDVMHDRLYHNHHRSYSRDFGSRESREYYQNHIHSSYGTSSHSCYQGYNQHMHPPRSTTTQRNTSFNSYTPPASQSSRHRSAPHRNYHPFQQG